MVQHKIWRYCFSALVASLLLLFSDSAYCGDPVPPEVQALVGVRVPPTTRQQYNFNVKTGERKTRVEASPGAVPGFTEVEQVLIVKRQAYSLGFVAGFIRSTPAFFVDRINSDFSREIIDAKPLPPTIYEHRLVRGEMVSSGGWGRLASWCDFDSPSRDVSKYLVTIGLVIPQKGKANCAHFSKQVVRAWGIEESGRIEDISSEGLVCHYVTHDVCE